MQRADVYLSRAGWFSSRERAQNAIAEGAVTVDGEVVKKSSKQIDETVEHDVRIGSGVCLYASRGGLKLESAVERFGLADEIKGAYCVDIGASTGGFTDCLLTYGAAHVWAVDCGSGQIVPRLRADDRVTVIENFNARRLGPDDVGGVHRIVTMDVSFISQTLIYPNVRSVLARGGALISLIKPQFECGRQALGKNGIVRDSRVRSAAIEKCRQAAALERMTMMGAVESPIRGGDGNIEYTALFRSV